MTLPAARRRIGRVLRGHGPGAVSSVRVSAGLRVAQRVKGEPGPVMRPRLALALVGCLQLLARAGSAGAQQAQCVPVGAPDFGTCAGLDSDCCKLWLLECNLACSSMLLPAEDIPADQVQKFECRGQTLKYTCRCEGDACPKSYCASSQCEQHSGGDYACDLPCSPQEYDVQCPVGQIPRFVKSFPTCPQHTPRYACTHFDRCERRGGEVLSLSASSGMEPVVEAPGFRRDPHSAAHRSARSGMLLSLVLAWTLALVRCR